jgi:mono/diheme cytochrome c family protein
MSDEYNKDESGSKGPAPLHGLLAEYETPWQLVDASKKVRDARYQRWDTYSPFAIHGMEKAMGIKMTVLPWIVLAAGLTGLATAIALQWWTNAVNYPWIVSGKPLWSIPANVPIMFELTVLFSGITALVAMLMLNGLPHPSHPLDLKERFARATDDRFFLLIEASDAKFDEKKTRALLEETGPVVLDEVLEDRQTSDRLPRGVTYAIIILTTAAMLPLALAAKARYTKSREPRIHLIGDMDWQPKYKAQRQNPVFADTRAQRVQVAGTIAVGELREDEHYYRGRTEGNFARTFPFQLPPTSQTIERGQERYGIFCAPCHGMLGDGQGMVTKRAEALIASGRGRGMAWVPPTDMTQAHIVAQPVGQLFDTITNGIRNMPAYGPQIPTEDRWAIVMYVRALQRRAAQTGAPAPEPAPAPAPPTQTPAPGSPAP